jgi:flagellar hook-basal body complex protein FliE
MAITPIGTGGLAQAGETIASKPAGQPGKVPFGQVIDQLLGDANGQQVQADQAVRELALGQSDNVHDVLLAVAKADLSFRMILEVRNRLTEAYQEIMRMQI